MENLDVLIGGAIPQTQAALQTERFKEILASAKERMTWSSRLSAVLPVADSLVLSTLVDGALLVVRCGHAAPCAHLAPTAVG